MSVICCRCQGANVSCKAMINPNTKEFIHYTDESFYYGWCDDCKTGRALTDPVEVKSKIEKAYKEHRKSQKDPLYASCEIVFTDEDVVPREVLFKLSLDVGSDDDEIFFYCNGLEELKSMTESSGDDFIVTDFIHF